MMSDGNAVTLLIFVTYSKLDIYATLGSIGQKQRVPGRSGSAH